MPRTIANRPEKDQKRAAIDSKQEPTIAAVATPLGKGGIGIVKISGEKAVSIGKKIFLRKSNTSRQKQAFGRKDSHRMVYGYIVDPFTKQIIDEVLICPMFSPKTYTREDVIEIHAHSGPEILKEILNTVLANGAELAQPGEFTKRAFINGRIDLTQAEAVMDIINAKSRRARELATKQMKGDLKKKLKEIRDHIQTAMAEIEVGIDFCEETEDELHFDKKITKNWRSRILDPISRLIDGSKAAERDNKGVVVSIVGKPNVGKSSLLNRLIKREQAIVSQFPGTTRDTVQWQIVLGGIDINFIDTAGIHSTHNPIEKLGIGKSRKAIEEADMILFVIDGQSDTDTDDSRIYDIIKGKNFLLVENKCDLTPSGKPLPEELKGIRRFQVSAGTGSGIGKLRETIAEKIFQDDHCGDENRLVSSMRHRKGLEESYEALKRAIDGFEDGLPPELVSLDFKESSRRIDEILGNHYCQEILDTIFSKFCIGK